MVTIIRYTKSTIDHAIYIKVSSDVTVSYLKFFTDDVINTTNNKKSFNELTIFFEEQFEMKVQEGSVYNYLNLRISQSPLGLSVEYTDQITELASK